MAPVSPSAASPTALTRLVTSLSHLSQHLSTLPSLPPSAPLLLPVLLTTVQGERSTLDQRLNDLRTINSTLDGLRVGVDALCAEGGGLPRLVEVVSEVVEELGVKDENGRVVEAHVEIGWLVDWMDRLEKDVEAYAEKFGPSGSRSGQGAGPSRPSLVKHHSHHPTPSPSAPHNHLNLPHPRNPAASSSHSITTSPSASDALRALSGQPSLPLLPQAVVAPDQNSKPTFDYPASNQEQERERSQSRSSSASDKKLHLSTGGPGDRGDGGKGEGKERALSPPDQPAGDESIPDSTAPSDLEDAPVPLRNLVAQPDATVAESESVGAGGVADASSPRRGQIDPDFPFGRGLFRPVSQDEEGDGVRVSKTGEPGTARGSKAKGRVEKANIDEDGGAFSAAHHLAAERVFKVVPPSAQGGGSEGSAGEADEEEVAEPQQTKKKQVAIRMPGRRPAPVVKKSGAEGTRKEGGGGEGKGKGTTQAVESKEEEEDQLASSASSESSGSEEEAIKPKPRSKSNLIAGTGAKTRKPARGARKGKGRAVEPHSEKDQLKASSGEEAPPSALPKSEKKRGRPARPNGSVGQQCRTEDESAGEGKGGKAEEMRKRARAMEGQSADDVEEPVREKQKRRKREKVVEGRNFADEEAEEDEPKTAAPSARRPRASTSSAAGKPSTKAKAKKLPVEARDYTSDSEPDADKTSSLQRRQSTTASASTSKSTARSSSTRPTNTPTVKSASSPCTSSSKKRPLAFSSTSTSTAAKKSRRKAPSPPPESDAEEVVVEAERPKRAAAVAAGPGITESAAFEARCLATLKKGGSPRAAKVKKAEVKAVGGNSKKSKGGKGKEKEMENEPVKRGRGRPKKETTTKEKTKRVKAEQVAPRRESRRGGLRGGKEDEEMESTFEKGQVVYVKKGLPSRIWPAVLLQVNKDASVYLAVLPGASDSRTNPASYLCRLGRGSPPSTQPEIATLSKSEGKNLEGARKLAKDEEARWRWAEKVKKRAREKGEEELESESEEELEEEEKGEEASESGSEEEQE
ncbi:hypothetical protein JCM11641_001652 [Rhodosporidiobolus odoratus]